MNTLIRIIDIVAISVVVVGVVGDLLNISRSKAYDKAFNVALFALAIIDFTMGNYVLGGFTLFLWLIRVTISQH